MFDMQGWHACGMFGMFYMLQTHLTTHVICNITYVYCIVCGSFCSACCWLGLLLFVMQTLSGWPSPCACAGRRGRAIQVLFAVVCHVCCGVCVCAMCLSSAAVCYTYVAWCLGRYVWLFVMLYVGGGLVLSVLGGLFCLWCLSTPT